MVPGDVRVKVGGIIKGGSSGWRTNLWPESGAVSPIPALDGLRALAVLLVMLFHSWWFMPGQNAQGPGQAGFPTFYGRTGVPLFFVLSGFLLFLPFARWMFGLRPRPSALLFYKRRALRVGPAYWVSLVILILAAPMVIGTLYDFLVHVAFLSSYFPDYFFSIDAVYWSMSVEVQFYVLLPLIGWLAYLLSRRLPPLVAGALTVLALLGVSAYARWLVSAGVLASDFGRRDSLLGFPSLPYWLSTFGDGIACAIVAVYLTEVVRLSRVGMRCLRAVGLLLYIAGVAFGLALFFVPRMHALRDQFLLFGVAYTCLLAGILFGPARLRAPFEWRPVRFVGLIAYSLYIWHNVMLWLIFPHVTALPDPREQVAVAFLLDILIAVPVAYLSYQLTERPFIQLRRQAHEAPAAAAQSRRARPRPQTAEKPRERGESAAQAVA